MSDDIVMEFLVESSENLGRLHPDFVKLGSWRTTRVTGKCCRG